MARRCREAPPIQVAMLLRQMVEGRAELRAIVAPDHVARAEQERRAHAFANKAKRRA
jgi:hypothetical protein